MLINYAKLLLHILIGMSRTFFRKIKDLFSRYFGFNNPRLLTLTVSPARIESMVEVNKGMDPRGAGLRMFLFAPEKVFDLGKPEQVFDSVWKNGRGY